MDDPDTRRAAALAAAAQLGPMTEAVVEAIAAHRAVYAIKRAQRDRRMGVADRRVGRADRRVAHQPAEARNP